jgi:opacity protein-like surface antigen
MIGESISRFTIAVTAAVMLAGVATGDAFAQSKPRPRPAAAARPQSNSVQIGGYAMFGNINFTAKESFDAILGSPSGVIFGGGARVGLPIGGLFVDVGAWRYRGEGERVFVANDQIFKLGIPVTVTVTPIEISAGWRFRLRRLSKLTPYAAGGFTILNYRETSEFSTAGDDTDESFNGYHAIGGAEYKITRWLGLAGEASWSTVPDAIGESGVSEAFNETNLGGTTFRVKITVGR